MATSALIEQGWHLTEEGIAECIENGNKSAQAIIKFALDTDLRHIGEKFLPDDINRGRVDYIEGPCVLQIQKIRNVSAPKDHEESQAAPRLLKLTLTDGHNNCSGVEMETIPSVSLNTPPGTKLVFSGTIPIENGFLLLNGRNTKCIGGRVEKLLENWELKRRLAKQHRAGIISEGGPPPFVPFGQKMIKAHIRTDNFKSLDIGKEKKESEEFEMQRRATIAEAVQAKEEGKAKTFGGNKQALNDKDVAHLVEMGFGTEHACQALRQNNGNVNEAIVSLLGKSLGLGPRDGGPRDGGGSRGNSNNSTSGQLKTSAKLGGEKPEKYHGRERKGRKKNDEKEAGSEDVAPSRPSGPATLFDFLETKIPIKEETKSHNERKSADTKKDSSCDRKLDVDVRQSSDNRKGAGNRRNNLPPRLSGKSNSGGGGGSNPGQNHGNSSNYAGNSYSSGPGYNNSGDGGGGNNTNSLPYSNTSHSGYDSHNSSHEYGTSNNQHNQHQTRYNNSNHNTNYNNSTSSVNNCGVIGNHQNYNNSHHPQSSSNFRNASPAGDSGHGSGTSHGPNHVLGNNTPSHYLQSQHRYNNNNSSTSIHNKLPAYQNYHGDTRQSGMAHNTNMRTPRNFSNNPGQVQVSQSSNYFNVNISGQQTQQQQQQQQQQHYANELNARYSSYNQKDMHHQNAGSDNPNKILSRDYHNHHQKQLQQQQQQQFSAASMKHPRKVLSNVTDSTGNENKHFGYDGGRTGQNYNSISRPKSGGGDVGGGGGASHKKQMDMDPADYKYQDRKNSHSPSTHSHNWRKGDHCLAKYWEDKKFYPAVIESVPDLPTCVVTFIEYGNTEEVLLTDIKPIPKNWHEISKQNSNSRGKDHTGQQQGFHNAGMMQQQQHHHHHHSGAVMPPHHQQMNSHQPQMTPTVAAVAAAAAAAAAVQHNFTASNSQYPGEQLMMPQSQISTMEFRRRGGGSAYARRMQQHQQQQLMLMQEKQVFELGNPSHQPPCWLGR